MTASNQTAYALHALLDLKEAGFEIDNATILLAVKFLMKHKIESDQGTYWSGGVYFTGGTALRNIIQWHSDAYTTALIASSLQRITME